LVGEIEGLLALAADGIGFVEDGSDPPLFGERRERKPSSLQKLEVPTVASICVEWQRRDIVERKPCINIGPRFQYLDSISSKGERRVAVLDDLRVISEQETRQRRITSGIGIISVPPNGLLALVYNW
jgi:hypothetical protein